MPDQMSLVFPGVDAPSVDPVKQRVARRTGAFTDNMALPIHRWFRYSAGFSAEWAESVIAGTALDDDKVVLDPFAGSGTTLLAAQRCGVRSIGADNHPFVARIAQTKLLWQHDSGAIFDHGMAMLDAAKARPCAAPNETSPLLAKCYTPAALGRLNALKTVWTERAAAAPAAADLLWLVLTSILRECSGVGTAQWQYVLPAKTKVRIADPFMAFAARLKMICGDMAHRQSFGAVCPPADMRRDDARSLDGFEAFAGRVGLVLTSPPYPNNYDYADATRLEMTFWDEVGGWGDLQGVVRHRLVRSCSQHSAAEHLTLDTLLCHPAIDVLRDDLAQVCGELARIRETKGGRKTYHTMIAAYFIDLARTWQRLRSLCAPGATVCFVVGDSAPYGVHVPVERWLARLALEAGFTATRFEKVRDRNTKWKNRKHRIPLQEGNLWVCG